MTLNHSGGLVLRWFRDTFGREEMREAQASGRDAYELLSAGCTSGAHFASAVARLCGEWNANL